LLYIGFDPDETVGTIKWEKWGGEFSTDLHPDAHLVLGSHMLEVYESIAEEKPSLEIHPLSIGR
jgi:L-arabinose isomerase